MSDQFDHLEAARTLATIEIPDDAYQPLPLAARFATAHALIDIAESLRTIATRETRVADVPDLLAEVERLRERESVIITNGSLMLEAAEAEAMYASQDYDHRGERLWRLAAKAGWEPGNPADNDATAELYVTDALDRLARARTILAEHPGTAWDSGLKLRTALLAALGNDTDDISL